MRPAQKVLFMACKNGLAEQLAYRSFDLAVWDLQVLFPPGRNDRMYVHREAKRCGFPRSSKAGMKESKGGEKKKDVIILL